MTRRFLIGTGRGSLLLSLANSIRYPPKAETYCCGPQETATPLDWQARGPTLRLSKPRTPKRLKASSQDNLLSITRSFFYFARTVPMHLTRAGGAHRSTGP